MQKAAELVAHAGLDLVHIAAQNFMMRIVSACIMVYVNWGVSNYMTMHALRTEDFEKLRAHDAKYKKTITNKPVGGGTHTPQRDW